MTAQVAQDLRAAADVLRRDGWTQKCFHDETGAHCMVGAVDVAIDPEWEKAGDWDAEQSERWAKARRVLMAVVGDQLTEFNDKSGRTADEVIAALEAAADAAEQVTA
jgi:hypothetical protein